MKYIKGTVGLLVIILILGAGLAAFGFLGFGGTSWKEEVLLHNGSKIIMDRWVDRGGRHEIGQKPPIKAERIIFRIPSSKQTVTWENKYSKEVGYADLAPIMLDIIDKTPYLVTHPVGCLAYNKWKRPNPPYIVFRYNNKEWQQIEVNELPSELKVPNLIISSPDVEAQRAGMNPVTAEKIRKLNNSLRQPEYKTILREPLDPKKLDCTEMIRVNDGWIGIEAFTSQPTYERCLYVCKIEKLSPEQCPCERLFKNNNKEK